MKKKSLIALVLVFSLILGLALTACGRSSGGSGGTKTLESVVASDSELREGIEEAAARENGLEIKIEGNELIYVYDLLAIEGADASSLKSDTVRASLEAGLDEQKSVFGGISKTLEDETKISGIKVTVTYTVGGDVIVSKTYTAADAD